MMTYFHCLPPTESYQWQLIFVRRFRLPMVPMATNGTNDKITNGTIGKTPNARAICLTLPLVPYTSFSSIEFIRRVDRVFSNLCCACADREGHVVQVNNI